MAFLERLTTLARADAHGVVDALEDRRLMLRQHLREARAELERKRARREALGAEDQDLAAESQRLGDRLETLEADLELALSSGEERLARFAARKLLLAQRRRGQIADRRQGLERERRELEERLAEQEAEFEGLEQRAKAFLAAHGDAAEGGAWSEPLVSDEDVELELLRRRTAAQGGAR